MSLSNHSAVAPVTRRRLLTMSAALMAGTALAAAAGRTFAQDGVALQFWKMPNMAAESENAYWATAVAGFREASGNSVEHLLVPWAEFLAKYTAAFVSGTAPDVSYQVTNTLNQFGTNGLLADLRAIDPALDTSAINEAMIASATQDGKLFGYPYISSRFVLALNEAVWEKAGKPALPTTYDELLQFAKKLTFDEAGKPLGDPAFDKSKVAIYGMAWPGSYEVVINYIWNVLFSYGVTPFSADMKDIGFDTPEGRAALEHLKALQDSGAATPLTLYADATQWAELLPAGKAGLQWVEANVQQFVNFPDARLQVVEPPAGPAGAFVSGAAGYLVIAEASANKAAALDFIKYVTSGAPYDDYIAQSLLFPVSTNADAAAMYGKVSEKRAYDFLAAALPQTKSMLFPAALPYNGYEYLVGEINNYLSGQKSLDQVISDARQQTATLAANAGL